MNITVIGSFKKYYEDICGVIDIMERNDVGVLSPKKSRIVKDIEGFVVLESDDEKSLPHMIQEHVFHSIRKSDFVYVWNPNGYLGNSTCYEIGKIMEMGKPLFFKEVPVDLPVKIDSSQIKDPEELVKCIKALKQSAQRRIVKDF